MAVDLSISDSQRIYNVLYIKMDGRQDEEKAGNVGSEHETV
jgi:hypothetical protein